MAKLFFILRYIHVSCGWYGSLEHHKFVRAVSNRSRGRRESMSGILKSNLRPAVRPRQEEYG